MKVYVVEGWFDWQGGEVLAVFSDKEDAEKLAKEKEGECYGTSVTEHELKESDIAKRQREKVKRILGRDNTLQLGC